MAFFIPKKESMSDHLNEEILESSEPHYTGTLPPFLNVLTILTFIGSGLGVVGGLYNLATAESQRADIERARSLMGDGDGFFGKDMFDSALLMLDNLYLIQGTALAVAIACIVGAILMRKLKKSGYYLYLVASIISVAVPIAVVGMMGGMMMFGVVFTLAFVIMYSVNVKHLR